LTLVQDLGEVHVTFLEGLGAAYRIRGYFIVIKGGAGDMKIDFTAVAFGGNYGGHNVNVQISEPAMSELMLAKSSTADEVEDLISEVQRRMLNNEMIVEYDKLKPESDGQDPFLGLGP
jgi:hypothetical protein